jgi:hypothetical protein
MSLDVADYDGANAPSPERRGARSSRSATRSSGPSSETATCGAVVAHAVGSDQRDSLGTVAHRRCAHDFDDPTSDVVNRHAAPVAPAPANTKNTCAIWRWMCS